MPLSSSRTGDWMSKSGVFFICKSRTHHVNVVYGGNGWNAVLGRLIATIARTDERRGWQPGPEPQKRPGDRPSPPGLIFDLIFAFYHVVCARKHNIFIFKYILS